MNRTVAIFELNDEETSHLVGAGEHIGRSSRAALCIDDPRISEAHAMVSLRGRGLWLLALRGRFRCDNKPLKEVELQPSLRIELAPGFFLTCLEVKLPTNVLAITWGDLPELIPSGTTTLHVDPSPRLQQGYDPEGIAVLWSVGDAWRLMISATSHTEELLGERSFELEGTPLHIKHMPLTQAALTQTKPTTMILPRIESCGNCVKVWREERSVWITGIPGKICAAVIEHDNAAHWRDVVDRVWPQDASIERTLRKRFDRGVERLRERFTQLGLLPEHLVLDGAGMLTINTDHLRTTKQLITATERGQDGTR